MMDEDERQSRAASARYNVTCPRCGAGPHSPCRTAKTRRITDTHLDRIKVRYGTNG